MPNCGVRGGRIRVPLSSKKCLVGIAQRGLGRQGVFLARAYVWCFAAMVVLAAFVRGVWRSAWCGVISFWCACVCVCVRAWYLYIKLLLLQITAVIKIKINYFRKYNLFMNERMCAYPGK